MKTIASSEFKASCLALLNLVKENHETLIITKHGKPVARVVPFVEESQENPLKDSIMFEKDVISPIDDEWDALNDNS